MVEASPSTLLRWIALLPLIGAVVHGVLLALVRKPLTAARLTIALSCGTRDRRVRALLHRARRTISRSWRRSRALIDDLLFTWIGSGELQRRAAFQLDPLSAVMMLVVTGVGSLIHIYSIGYMDDDHRDDRGFQRFFCYLNLFTFSMLMLVLARQPAADVPRLGRRRRSAPTC